MHRYPTIDFQLRWFLTSGWGWSFHNFEVEKHCTITVGRHTHTHTHSWLMFNPQVKVLKHCQLLTTLWRKEENEYRRAKLLLFSVPPSVLFARWFNARRPKARGKGKPLLRIMHVVSKSTAPWSHSFANTCRTPGNRTGCLFAQMQIEVIRPDSTTVRLSFLFARDGDPFKGSSQGGTAK